MKNNHLSIWEQEEYIIDGPAPEAVRHLAECAGCRAAVEQMEQSLMVFRGAALEWSSQCLAARPQPPLPPVTASRPVIALRWAFAAALPILLLVLALLPWHLSKPVPARPAAQISDDALLDQVDEQLSVAVPSSMESLTHLVTTESGAEAGRSGRGSKHLVNQN